MPGPSRISADEIVTIGSSAAKAADCSIGSTTTIIRPLPTARSLPSEGLFLTIPLTTMVDEPPPSWLIPQAAAKVSWQKDANSPMVIPTLLAGSRPSTTRK